jgi:hypothetical protein
VTGLGGKSASTTCRGLSRKRCCSPARKT